MRAIYKYKVEPHLNIKEYLTLPNFEVAIKKNSEDVYECYIKDFKLYVHSAESDFDSAFSKIQDRVQGLVITHILEALLSNKSSAIYGKKTDIHKNKTIKKLEDSHRGLVKSSKHLEKFVESVTIPFSFSYSQQRLTEIQKMLKDIIREIRKKADITEKVANEILLKVLPNITLFHFKQIT